MAPKLPLHTIINHDLESRCYEKGGRFEFIILRRIPEPYSCIREFQTEKKIFQTNQHTKHKEFNTYARFVILLFYSAFVLIILNFYLVSLSFS